MIKEEYSPYKIVHHIDKITELKNGKQPYPLQIHLVPTNKCNQQCVFCAYRMHESSSNQKFNPMDFIPANKLYEIIDSCGQLGIKAIQFTGGGEPLIHPNIKDVFLKTSNCGLEIGLVTNGQAFDDELIEMASQFSWLRISFDSSTRGTYSILRRTSQSNYDKVIKTIKTLVSINNRKVTLGIGFVVCKENFEEIYEACKLFQDIGVDNIRISAVFTPLGIKYFDGILDKTKETALKAKQDFETEKFTVFNLFNERIKDLFDGKQEYDHCPMKDLVPYIGADMNVYTCCILAYNELGLIGSISNQTLFELWNSKHKIDIFNRHSPRKFCQLPCMFEEKNHFINYCIKSNSKHINFI